MYCHWSAGPCGTIVCHCEGGLQAGLICRTCCVPLLEAFSVLGRKGLQPRVLEMGRLWRALPYMRTCVSVQRPFVIWEWGTPSPSIQAALLFWGVVLLLPGQKLREMMTVSGSNI